MKEHLIVTPENLTTNFMSNMSFFKRYRENIFGVSGTLGSSANKMSLCKSYNVDIGIIPPFRKSRFQRLPAILTFDDISYVNSVIDQISLYLNWNRAILLICETISNVLEFKLYLE